MYHLLLLSQERVFSFFLYVAIFLSVSFSLKLSRPYCLVQSPRFFLPYFPPTLNLPLVPSPSPLSLWLSLSVSLSLSLLLSLSLSLSRSFSHFLFLFLWRALCLSCRPLSNNHTHFSSKFLSTKSFILSLSLLPYFSFSHSFHLFLFPLCLSLSPLISSSVPLMRTLSLAVAFSQIITHIFSSKFL